MTARHVERMYRVDQMQMTLSGGRQLICDIKTIRENQDSF